jgi:hypothetical protein
MPVEKPLTADDIKPGVRVRFRGGEVLRIVAVDEAEGRVQLVSEEPDPSLERSVSGMLRPLLDGRTRYTVVESPDDTPLHRLRDGTTGTTLEALTEALREVEALSAALGWMPVSIREAIRTGNVKAATEWATRGESFAADQQAIINSLRGKVADLDRQLAETVEHAMKVDTENERLKAEPAAKTRDAALDRLVRQDKDIEELRKHVERQTKIIGTVSAEKRALEREKAAIDASFQRESREHAETANKLDDWRDKWAVVTAGLRDAIEAIGDMTGFTEAAYYAEKYGIAETVARLQKLLPESFHPPAQAPEITGESGPGIVSPVAAPAAFVHPFMPPGACPADTGRGPCPHVSPVATEDSGATVDRGADDAWAAKELRVILDDATFDERHGDDGRRAVEHAIRALAP